MGVRGMSRAVATSAHERVSPPSTRDQLILVNGVSANVGTDPAQQYHVAKALIWLELKLVSSSNPGAASQGSCQQTNSLTRHAKPNTKHTTYVRLIW